MSIGVTNVRRPDGTLAKGASLQLRHGMANSRLYLRWRAMRSRCEDPGCPAYPNYGGRGITVCERWHDFANFYADMGEPGKGQTIERIDNNAGYSPDNCCWASRSQQSINRRSTVLYRIGDVEQSLSEWSAHSGLSISTLWARINNGWSVERAVTTPKRLSRRWHGKSHMEQAA